jgi:hypothetical protein
MRVCVGGVFAPATLTLGCDGFALARFGRTHYVSFTEVARIEHTLRGVKVVRREGRPIWLLNYGISVSARDYIVDFDRRFDQWIQSPEPTRRLPGMGFRVSDADPVAEALNPRLSAGERLEAFDRIGDERSLKPIIDGGAAFADPNVAIRREELETRRLRSR